MTGLVSAYRSTTTAFDSKESEEIVFAFFLQLVLLLREEATADPDWR